MSNLSLRASMTLLYEFFPDAQCVRDEVCDCGLAAPQLTFVIPELGEHPDPRFEFCSVFCASCGINAWGVRSRARKRLLESGFNRGT